MRKFLAASLLAFTITTSLSTAALAEPAKKEDLMVAPDGARHYVIVSQAGKHGDLWAWEQPDGTKAYRMSMSLRGWITETDQTIVNGADGRPIKVAVHGFTDSGDATESLTVDADGIAHWKTSVDEGSAPYAGKFYSNYGGPWVAAENDLAGLIAAGEKGLDLLPSGHAEVSLGQLVDIDGPNGPEKVRLAFVQGYGFSPSPFWLTEDNRLFGFAGGMSMLPEGYEANALKLKEIQDAATADKVKEVAHTFLTPANQTPTLVDNVTVFDSLAGTYLAGRSVLIADGKIAKVGPAGTVKASKLATVIDGKGKTLVPGLWDAHRHVGGGDDWNLLQNVATGMTNYRSPGSEIDDVHSIVTRRAAGDLLAPEGMTSIIVDRKDPLAAQGSLTVSSLEETIAAVHQIKDAGMWGVKFYTSMTPAWIAPAAAEAHKLGLHVHGHIPAGMRPLDAVRAGYDEVTHINFIMMQAMPQEVVDKSNTAARLEGPAKYGKDVDLDSPEMTAFYKELGERGTYIDPTLVVWEPALTSDGSEIAPGYAPFAKISPPGVSRGWKIAGYPLFDGLTRDDFRKSFDKLVGLVGRLHEAGAPIVAGTDGWGLELVRELELYEDAGLTNAEALQTATIIPARLTGMDKDFGSVTEGKVANLVLVDGDVSQDIGKLRKVETVFLDGYRLSGDALRKASGLSGMPE
ncbi:amidohydrolase family protein [Qipengyuania soli]|uniref:Amidohydrolase family protein n=1 Tax=Qipengyuania soli TaxID=2782568 RepID=A0A7S8F2D6_9SPHN|nr:amidohydrolase family protein [Qipengyuania soli]QPC97979.1 amidohydrolase family protein [Qipengyuania soli]